MAMSDTKFFVKKPDQKGRKSYVIVAYEMRDRNKKEYVKLSDSVKTDVAAINKKFHDKVIDASEAELLLQDLIEVQYRKSKVQATVLKATRLSDANSKVLAKFWAEKYEVKYHADGGKSARNDFARTFRAIEPHSIQSASQADIQNALKKNLTVLQVRRASDRLNEVLRWLKRDFILNKPKKPRKVVKHLTKTDFYKMVPCIQCPECKLLAESLFASGMRIGEAMALNKDDLSENVLSITKQRVTYSDEEKLPKREKTGDVVVFEFGLEALNNWIDIKDKWQHRWHVLDQLTNACYSAKVKRVTPHDLRHSHAIHLLAIGGTLTDVSMNLRDRIEVCQEYYTGFCHTEGTLDRLKKLFSESKK